jgi:hypothetical protein
MVMDVRLWCNTGMGGGADRPDWVAMAEMAANSGFYKARIARLVHAAAVAGQLAPMDLTWQLL